MKSFVVTGMIILAASFAFAGTPTMDDAINAFDSFHEAMHPAWHDAYPAKDYAALFASAPKFVEKYAPIAKLDPPIKNAQRRAAFKAHQQEMGIFLTQYADACRKQDSAMAYKILPQLHEAFEQSVGTLEPMECKMIDGLMVTADVILDMHIPAENWEGMQGSTETIFTKLDHITDSLFPAELVPAKAEVTKALAGLRATATEMQGCLDKKDMACFREKATALKTQIAAIRQDYL